jgi:hypothetical protein
MAFRSRSLRLTTVTAGLLLLGSTVTAQAATRSAAAPAIASTWAGYAAHTGTYTSVTASWAEPAATCSSSAVASSAEFWVGLDGYSDSTVEQVGTEVDCFNGVASQAAWYNLYPAAAVDVARPVSAGDMMTATVTATTGDAFTLTLSNVTDGWTFSTTKVVSGAARSSAEVILEAPATAAANAGTVSFSNIRIDGSPLAASDPTGINIGTGIGPHCGLLAGSGASFTCTW